MTKLLISIINKKGARHEDYGVMSGIVGIVCNLVLSVFKFIVGNLSGSISVTADALNNLSDMASNSVTIAGTKLASKPVDKEHPFGHGRLEYISALVVSGLILVMGFELAKSSIEKIIHPETLDFSAVYIIVLGASVLVKLWMAYFNNKLYKISDNINLKTVKQDSLNDCLATLATIIALSVTHIWGIKWFDGAIGLCVSVIILLSGIDIARDIVSRLLGRPPKKELVDEIESEITKPDIIFGVHDLIVHDYGPGRIIASAHAEVPADASIVTVHDVIDNIEQTIADKYGIMISLHTDPIELNDDEVNRYRALAEEIIHDYNSEFTFHDFRVVKGETHTNLIFDLIIPFDKEDKTKINADLVSLFAERDKKLVAKIKIEHSYI